MGTRPPDLAALYLKHRDALHRVAASVLRDRGLTDHANDVVQDAFLSIMTSPPKAEVRNWEAFLVTAVKRKAIDRLRSAEVKHAGPELAEEHDQADVTDIADEATETVDRRRLAAKAYDALAVLDERQRKVAWDYLALERPRAQVAAELEVTPARVSQIAAEVVIRLREEMDREEVINEQERA